MKKRYRVDVSQAAEDDIRSAHDYIAADKPQAAARGVADIERMIMRLENSPFAYEVIPEAADLGVAYRHKLFGKYRILYRVEADRVLIVRLIHSSRLLDQSMFVT